MTPAENVALAASRFLETCDENPIQGMTADQGFLWDDLAAAVELWEKDSAKNVEVWYTESKD